MPPVSVWAQVVPAGMPSAAAISALVSPPAAAMVRVTRCCSGRCLIIAATTATRSAAITGVLIAVVFGVLAHAGLAGTIRQLRPLSIAPRLVQTLDSAELNPAQGRYPGPVAITTFHEPSFVFLTGKDTQLTDGAGAARALAEGRPAIVEARDDEAFRRALAELGAAGRAVGVVSGHNYSSGNDVRLTVYAPAGAGERSIRQ